MKIKIDDIFSIESDAYNITVYRKATKDPVMGGPKKGTKVPVGYYNSITQAVNGLMKYITMTSDATDMYQLGKDRAEMLEKLKRMCDGKYKVIAIDAGEAPV